MATDLHSSNFDSALSPVSSSAGDSYVVADIGGTNARFAICSSDAPGFIDYHDDATLHCRDYKSLSSVLDDYLQQVRQKVAGACISIAGPINGDLVRMTNLSWAFSASEFKQRHNLTGLWLINDATAGALATTCSDSIELDVIKPGDSDSTALRINLVPGTGFGAGCVMPYKGGWVPIQGEGGHATLAAVSSEEFDVLRYISEHSGRAIPDQVLSGPGMLNLYHALAKVRGLQVAELTAPDVTRQGLDQTDALSVDTLELYCTLLGRFAGDMALMLNAHGGIYLSGNLLQTIGCDRLSAPFRKGFTEKTQMSDKVISIPVFLLRHENPGLLGAAVWLESQLAGNP